MSVGKKIEKPRIAVLGISLSLYKDAFAGYMERLDNRLKMFQARFDSFAHIGASCLCYEKKQLQIEIKRAEELEVDALVLIPMSYTASLMTLGPALMTTLPLIIWNTQETFQITDAYNFDDLLMNHVAQGTQDLTGVLIRSGRTFGLESGHYQDKEALKRLSDWLNAARAFRFAKNLRVGLLGSPFQDMGDFGVDETAMIGRWGPSVWRLSLPRFIQLINEVDEDLVKQKRIEDLRSFDMAPEITADDHCLSLRLELALRKMIEEQNLDAFTMNFQDLIADGRAPTLPFLGINKLLGEGLGYAGEGNVTIAALMAQLRRLCGVSNFTEIYTVDYKRNLMVMTHMQECNPALARKDRKIRLVRKEFWAPGIKPYVGMHFTLEPGPVTLCNLTTDRQGNFYCIVSEAEIMDMPPFQNLDVPHWVVELQEPVGDFLTKYSLAGGTHHLAAVPGKRTSAIQKLAVLQGWKSIVM